MLMIRFQRVGRRNDPAFRIVVTEKRSKPKSGELEILGSFHPKTKETRFKAERISYWFSQGAQASPRVHNLLVSRGVIKGEKIPVAPVLRPAASPAPAAEPVPTAETSAPTPAEPPPAPTAPSGPEAPEPPIPAARIDGPDEDQVP